MNLDDASPTDRTLHARARETRLGTCLFAKAMLALVITTFGACGGGGSPAPLPTGTTLVAPAITAQPSATAVIVGGTASFSATASGTPAPTVQWQRSTDGGATWTDIAGATGTTETTSAVTAADDGTRFRAVFSNGAGTAITSAVALTVMAARPVVVGLNLPGGVAVDSSGNLYVADTFNNVIRKVTPAGVATVLAGQLGARGNVDANGTAARFYTPVALAVDSGGTVYVADANNCAIRKIAPNGDVSTLAGHTVPSCLADLNGTGTAASFQFPTGVVLDGFGNVFVSESGGGIRMIRPTGEVTTLAGSVAQGEADGLGSSATFNAPAGIAIDGANTSM